MKIQKLKFEVKAKPISINKAYRSIIVRGRPAAILTSEGKHFKRIVGICALGVMKSEGFELITGPFSIAVDYFFQQNRGDVTNFDKALIDGMKGIVFKDDSQCGSNVDRDYIDAGIFFHATFRKWVDRSNPRTEVTISFYH